MLKLKSNKLGFEASSSQLIILYRLENPNYIRLQIREEFQDLFIPSSVDTNKGRDLVEDIFKFEISKTSNKISIVFYSKSEMWSSKKYVFELFEDYISHYFEIEGESMKIDTVRYFEGILAKDFKEDFYLTKHFNDKKQTPYRNYSSASKINYNEVFNPEPNSYNYQQFKPYESSQISVNSDLDYCGGNFIANPGILCFLLKYNSFYLTLGLAPNQGEYRFSEYELIGGSEFGLNLNYWFSYTTNKFISPILIIKPSMDKENALKEYIDILRSTTGIIRNKRESHEWWNGPIFCGWGHQSYMSDLFRIRSPKERQPDNATYSMSTQGNYELMVKILEQKKINYKILIIDSRWFQYDGIKNIDEGKWPDLKGFVAKMHNQNKKVLLWWNPWGKEGFDNQECIFFDSKLTYGKTNRPGRFAKFGAVNEQMKLAPDITVSSVQHKVSSQIKYLISEVGIDGFKIDHVAATPGIYGLEFPKDSLGLVGIELLKYYLEFFYQTVKSIKKESLVIGQSPNSYLESYQDMIRLGDIYSKTSESVLAEMKFRSNMSKLACPSCLIDTDGWPLPSKESWTEYIKHQGEMGVPSLYYLTHLDTSGEEIDISIVNDFWK